MIFKNVGRALSALIVVLTLILSVSVYADTLTIDAKLERIDLNGVVKITGNIGRAVEGENVTLTVFVDGNYQEGLLDALSQKEYVSAFDDTYTDNEGNFIFTFMINGEQKSGLYTAYISDSISENPVEVEFFYCNPEARKLAIGELNAKTTEQEVFDFIFGENGKWMDLGFYSPLQSKVDKTKLSGLIWERLNKVGVFDPENGDKVTAEYLYIEIIEALNEKALDNVFDYKERLLFEDSSVSTWSEKDYMTAEVQKSITNRVSGKGFKRASEFEDLFIETLILETVENNDGPGTVRDILKAYKSRFTAEIDKATISNFRQIIGEYSTIAQLDEKLKEVMKNNNSSSSGGGGGSSGGGGGASVKDKENGGMNGVNNSSIEISPDDKKPVPTIVENERFSDLNNVLWAKEAINYLYDKGVINGRREKIFAPDEKITREEFVKIIALAFNIDITNDSVRFVDVKSGEWYEKYVNSVYNAGVINGIGENMFGTGQNISRQDMAVMVYNAAKINGKTLNVVNEKIEFTDTDTIADYAREAVFAMQMAGVVSGVGDNLFMPLGNATRAEAAKMVYGIISLQ